MEYCSKDDFLIQVKTFGAKVDEELCRQIAEEWYSNEKKKVDLHGMAAYYLCRNQIKTGDDV